MKDLLKILLNVDKIKLLKFQKKCNQKYPQSQIYPQNIFDLNLVEIGKYTYGDIYLKDFGNKENKLIIGNYCSIAENVKFLLAGEHNYKHISSYPFKKKFLNQDESISKGNIVIKDDVWIGYGSIILSGVTIGQGAIVGAGSIVTKDIPPYAIFAGNKIIKYRFDEKMIEKLMKIHYENLDKNQSIKHLDLLYQECNEENIDLIIEKVFGGVEK